MWILLLIRDQCDNTDIIPKFTFLANCQSTLQFNQQKVILIPSTHSRWQTIPNWKTKTRFILLIQEGIVTIEGQCMSYISINFKNSLFKLIAFHFTSTNIYVCIYFQSVYINNINGGASIILSHYISYDSFYVTSVILSLPLWYMFVCWAETFVLFWQIQSLPSSGIQTPYKNHSEKQVMH